MVFRQLFIALLLGLMLLPEAAFARRLRPAAVVYVRKWRGKHRILYQPIRYGRRRWLTRSSQPPTALQCSADGRHVVYAQDGKVWARRVTRRGKPMLIKALPKAVWQLFHHQLRTFIQPSPTGQYVALPDAKGVRVHDLKTGKSLVIQPPTSAGEAQKKVRVIHPARWLPGARNF